MSVSASGQFAKTITFDKRGYAREYVIPANPQSDAQVAVRNILADIQAELKQLGEVLRPLVKSNLGYRWNSLIIQELMANDHATWDAHLAVFGAFSAPNKADWLAEDPGIGLHVTTGAAFYIAAKAFYDVNFRVGADGLITEPIETNSATVGPEWIDDTP